MDRYARLGRGMEKGDGFRQSPGKYLRRTLISPRLTFSSDSENRASDRRRVRAVDRKKRAARFYMRKKRERNGWPVAVKSTSLSTWKDLRSREKKKKEGRALVGDARNKGGYRGNGGGKGKLMRPILEGDRYPVARKKRRSIWGTGKRGWTFKGVTPEFLVERLEGR